MNPTPTQQGETLEPPERIQATICQSCNTARLHETRCRACGGKLFFDDEVEYVRAAVAGPRGDVLLEIIKQVTKKHHESRTHPPTYCCPEDEPFYDRQLAKMLVEAIAAATSSPAPAEPMQTFDYMCNAQPSCGWRSTDTSRPLSRGIKVGCPNCQGDARFIGATSAPAENESPILAFDKWLMRYVVDHGKLTQQEYSIAYAAFIAAHPGEGPLARTMNAAPADNDAGVMD